jgi:hypothetical protein
MKGVHMNTKLLLVTIGVAALLLSISSWTPPVIISTHEDNIQYFNRGPQLVIDDFGNSYVTWQGSDGNDKEVYWVKINAEGIPGQAQKISIHPDNRDTDDWQPQIGIDGSGNSYVTWGGFDGNDHDIYWVKIDASGTPGTIQNISDHPEGADHDDGSAEIAVDASGNSYVTWSGFDGNDKEIYWVKIDASGVLGTIKNISTHPDNIDHHDYYPHITRDPSGNSYIVWQGCVKEDCWKEPGDFEIYWVKIDTSGTPGKVVKVPPTDPDNIDTMAMKPQIAVDAQGNSSIVWSGKNEQSNDIYWVKIDTSGELGDIQRISAYPDSSYGDYHPKLAADTEGNSYITWCGSDGNDREIYWVKIDSSGIPGTVQKVSNYFLSGVYEDSNPQIAVDVQGNSYITWNSFNGGFAEKFDLTIRWTKVDTEGNPGRAQNISSNQYSKHFDRNSRVAVDTQGNSYVVWEGDDESKHDHIFFTAHLPDQTLIPRVIFIMVILIAAVVIAAGVVVVRRKIKKKKALTQ